MTVNEAFRGSNLFSRLSKVYGLLTLQDLLDRVQSKVEHSPADSSAEVRYGTYGTCASNYRDPERSERGLVMNQRETDTSEQVLKFAPKEKAPNRVAQLDDAGQAIVAQIRTAADLAKEDCDRAMSLAHKLSMELRAAEDRTQQMAREVEHWQERAARAEQWLRTIQQEIEEKLLSRRPSPGGVEAVIR
jgi:hypothetical protein